MSLLIGALPESVTTSGGESVPINTDARIWISFEVAIQQGQAEADPTGFIRYWRPRLCSPRRQHGLPLAEVWDALLGFYRCGRPDDPSAASGRCGEQAYDFEQDAPLIVAAFQQAYGIDLTQESMHWWRFRALFDGLPDSCRICKIMEYRTADTSDMPEQTRKIYDKMRERYRIKRPTERRTITVEDHDADFIRRLRRQAP